MLLPTEARRSNSSVVVLQTLATSLSQTLTLNWVESKFTFFKRVFMSLSANTRRDSFSEKQKADMLDLATLTGKGTVAGRASAVV